MRLLLINCIGPAILISRHLPCLTTIRSTNLRSMVIMNIAAHARPNDNVRWQSSFLNSVAPRVVHLMKSLALRWKPLFPKICAMETAYRLPPMTKPPYLLTSSIKIIKKPCQPLTLQIKQKNSCHFHYFIQWPVSHATNFEINCRSLLTVTLPKKVAVK